MDENCGVSGEWGSESGEMALERQCKFNVTLSTCTNDDLTNYEECQNIALNSSLGVLVWFEIRLQENGCAEARRRPRVSSQAAAQ